MRQITLINSEDVSESEALDYRLREAVRAIVFDEQNRIALLHATNNHYYKLPGGGVEAGEDHANALKRECKEEVGCEIEITGELGLVIEYRKKYELKQISYCYIAKLKGEKGEPDLTESEIAEGFETVWASPVEAKRLISESEPTVYGGIYMVPRDAAILEAFENNVDCKINNTKTLSKILAQYGIRETESVELIRESGDNQVYLVGKDSEKKILRISKRLPVKDVQFEFEVAEYLKHYNFPVAEWIKTEEGNFYSLTDNTEVAVMFGFLDGYHVDVDKDSLPTTEQAATAGRMLGTMARLGAAFTSSSSRQRTIFTEVNRVLENEATFEKDFEGGEKFICEIRDAIAFAQENKSPVGLMHNDYRVGNVFFKNDGELSGVIDFDWSCIGPQIKDLALGVLEWSCPDGRTEPDFSIFDAFLDGYNSTSIEKIGRNKELYSWIMFAALSDTATFFCDRLSVPELKREIACSYMYRKYLYFSKL